MELEEDSSLEEEDWNDFMDEREAPGEAAKCFFGNETFASVEAALQHDSDNGFDFREYRRKVGLDDIETIMCINFIRSRSPTDARRLLSEAVLHGGRPWRQDAFMRPVLEDDAMLLHDWDEEDADAAPTGEAARQDGATDVSLRAALAALGHENATLRATVHELASYMPPELAAEISKRFEGDAASSATRLGDLAIDAPSSSRAAQENGPTPLVVQKPRSGPVLPDRAAVDANYFDSYSRFGIHREMLSDKVRTEAYRLALEGNPDIIRDATVLDVGCGTGILSLFAARGGASAVFGVDGSAAMAEYAAGIAEVNGLSSNKGGPVTILPGRLEELAALPVAQVDVIVSEWMGYTLFYEAMLDTVLHARDRWLRPGGAMLPDAASLFLAGASAGALGTAFWADVYGFSMAPIATGVLKAARGKALVAEVARADVLTEACAIRRFDLTTMRPRDADFSAGFELHATAEANSTPMCAVVIWFEVEFGHRFCRQQPVVLSTSPHSQQTHWAQTVLPLKDQLSLTQGPVRGRISLARSKEHRSLDISLEYEKPSSCGQPPETCAGAYSIAMS